MISTPLITAQHYQYMQEAIKLAEANIANEKGRPFGAVIVKDGKIIASTANSVTTTNDPTAHAEVNAIRSACKYLKTFDLTGCEIYASCEPCPMCFSAIYWARIGKVYYAASKRDAAKAGFDDSLIYDELAKEDSNRCLKTHKIEVHNALAPFKKWAEAEKKATY